MNNKQHVTDYQLQAYLDQALDSSSTQDIKNHLDQCQAYREEFFKLEEVVLKFNALPELELETDISSRVLDQLREEKQIPRGITWTIALEAIGAGAVIGLLIPALRAATWMPRLLDTQNEIQAAINIFFTQLASSWLVWWAGMQMELDQISDVIFSGPATPDLSFSPWILILAAGGIGIFINYLILRADTGSVHSLNQNNQ